MNENWKWFLSFWTLVAAALISLSFSVAGWLEWARHLDGLTTGATLVTTLILLVSALVAWRQLKDAQVTRHGELMLAMSERWDRVYYKSAAIFALYSDTQIKDLLLKTQGGGKAVPTAQEVRRYLTLVSLPNLIEEIADFQRYGAISPEAIDVIWGDRIISAWRQWEPLANYLRQLLRSQPVASPEAFADFQVLAESLQERRAQNGRRR